MPQPRIIGIGLILSMLAVIWESGPSGVHAPLLRPETAAAQAPGLTPATLKIGLPTGKTSFANVDVVIAQEAGFFTQQGLDVTLHNFDSGVKVVQAVVANEVAIGGASIEPVVNASVAGGDIVIIGTYANRLTVSMITPKTVTAAAELRGKHVGIQDVGAFREVMTRMVLESVKLTPQDVHYVPVSAPGYVPALMAGQIQSAILQTEQAIDILGRDARFHVLVDLYTVEPDYFYGTYFAKKDWLATHPDLAIRYLTGLIQAHRFMYQHKADTIRIAAKATGFTVDVIDKTYERLLVNNTIFPLNDGLEDQRLMYTITKMRSLGLFKGKEPELAQLVDRRPITQALEKLGIVRP